MRRGEASPDDIPQSVPRGFARTRWRNRGDRARTFSLRAKGCCAGSYGQIVPSRAMTIFKSNTLIRLS
jgi:hypothetical protein